MKTVVSLSQKQEKSVAKLFKGRRTPASGALWGQKADVKSDKFLIECKTTGKDYYTLSARTWEKIREEAIQDHMRIPLLIVDFEYNDRYIVFNPSDFETDIRIPHIVTAKAGKSIRISPLDSCVHYKQFVLKDKRRNILCLMEYYNFTEEFKDEIKGEI